MKDCNDCIHKSICYWAHSTSLSYADKCEDFEPKKMGHWINDKGLYKCSVCNDLCTIVGWANCIPKEQMYKAVKYCPNCGADMRKEQE